MFRRIDRSSFLARLIERLSATLAKRRGLPVVLGILLVGLSFVFYLISTLVDSQVLSLLWGVTLHFGILIALIGILLVEPLGR